MRFLRIGLCITVSLFISACSRESAQDPAVERQIQAGEQIFQQNCTECHAKTGRGDYLKRIPATLLTQRSEQELKTWIAGKNEHREMPSFDGLNDEQLQSLAAYLKSQILK